DEPYERTYTVPNPVRVGHVQFNSSPDYAAVQKIFERESGRLYFFISGLGDRATRGAARYLAKNWSSILDAHPEDSFAILLMLRPGSEYHEIIELNRATGQPIGSVSPKSS